MATLRTPRAAWIAAARDALETGGPGAVRVEVLAKRLGVSKGGFYWHFADRDALLTEVLDAWEEGTVDEVIRRSEESSDPKASLRRFFADVAPSTDLTGELAIREWGRHDPAIATRLQRVDARRLGWIRGTFAQFCSDDEADARSLLAYSLLIGSYLIVSHPGGRTRAETLGLAVEHLLSEA